MALLTIYAGDSSTVSLQFADDAGNPTNISGFEVRGVAKQYYTDTSGIFNKTVTGIDANAVTGLVYFPLTSGDTNQCATNYLLDFFIKDLSGNRSTYQTDGLSILPTTYV